MVGLPPSMELSMKISPLICAAIVAFSVAPASACIIAPRPVEKFWPTAPSDIAADEVVLEVQFVSFMELEPRPSSSSDQVVVTGCGTGGIFQYKVTRVLAGVFAEEEIYLSVGSGGFVGENQDGKQRHVIVGRLGPSVTSDEFSDFPSYSTALGVVRRSVRIFQARSPTVR
jgi:hypothetical protein